MPWSPKRDQIGPNFYRRTVQLKSTAATSGQLPWDNLGDNPMAAFSLQVSFLDANGNFLQAPTGSPTWEADLFGSNDGVAPTELLQHINGTNDNGATIFTSTQPTPVGYTLLTWKNLVWGSADSIVISVLGVPNVNLKG